MNEPRVGETQIDGPITNLRRSIPMSLLREDNSNNEVDSPHYQTRVQCGQIQRKIEEFPDIRTLDILVQTRIQEAELQFRSKPISTAAKVSDSPILKRFWSA